MNLGGLRILNTRPTEQAITLTQAIEAAKGISIALPALVIEPTSNEWLKQIPDLNTFNQAIFISPNAVHYFFKTIIANPPRPATCSQDPAFLLKTDNKNAQIHLEGSSKQPTGQKNRSLGFVWPKTIQVIAIGQATAKVLQQYHIRVDHLPVQADSEHLLQLDSCQHLQNQQILLIKGEGGRMTISDTLRARGAQLLSVAVYKRSFPHSLSKLAHSLWQDDAVDIILFTSEQAIHHIVSLFGEEGRGWLCKKPCIVISDRLAKVAMELGMQTILVSRYDMLMSTLADYNKKD